MNKYKIVRTGEYFFYDPLTNALYDQDAGALSKPFVPPVDWEDLKQRFGRDTLDKSPETIKVTLGHGCNYSCSYCLQKDIGNPDERPENGLTPMLIKNIRRHLDISSTTRFELWGGETLLYWKDIVALMEEFDNENITWYIPTNGTPLMKKHIDFFMQLKGTVAMGISHDGPAHETLRGKEFLHKKIEVFQQIQQECGRKVQYSFNPVISRYNYDLFKINDFFVSFFEKYGLSHKQLSFELGRSYDEASARDGSHHVICGDDLPKYQDILTRYLAQHIAQRADTTSAKSLLMTSLFHTGMGVIPYAKTMATHCVPLIKTNCGVDDSRLISLDMNSNVHTCQNTGNDFIGGNLLNLKGVKIKNVTFDRSAHCNGCPVRVICKSSCPLNIGPTAFGLNCGVEKVHYTAIQQAAFKLLFNSDVERVE